MWEEKKEIATWDRKKKHEINRTNRMNESSKCIERMIVQLFWPHHNFKCTSTRHTHSYINVNSFASKTRRRRRWCAKKIVSFYGVSREFLQQRKMKHNRAETEALFCGLVSFQLLKIISSFCFFFFMSSKFYGTQVLSSCLSIGYTVFAPHRDSQPTDCLCTMWRDQS